MMDFDHAAELAREIHESPNAELLAVGRFVHIEEIDGKPWGCSIRVLGEVSSRVVWTRAEWLGLDINRAKPKRRAKAPCMEDRPDKCYLVQPHLF